MALNRNAQPVDPSVDHGAKRVLRRGLPSDSPFLGGVPLAAAMSRATATTNQNLAATTAPEAPAAAPQLQDNIGQANLAALDNLGKPLARGVTRYQMDPGNEAAVYTTRGKDGSTIFTDNADYAARNSAGGLRRGDVNANVLARTQGPRAGYEYAKSALQQKGLRREDFQDLAPDATQQALAVAGDANAADPNSDFGLSNRIDANLLRARRFTQQQQDAANASALSPRDQIALMRAQTAAAQGNERNTIAQGQLEATREGVRRQGAAEDRAAQKDFFTQYQGLKANDPKSAENYLFNAIPQDPQEFDKWSGTPAGRSVLNTYLTDVLQPQMSKSLFPIEWGDRRQVPHENFGNLALGQNGDFQGFVNPDGSTNEYPAKGVFGSDNYGSINRFSPAILRRLKRLNTGTQ